MFLAFRSAILANPKTWLCIVGLRKQPKEISAGNPQPKDSAISQIPVPETLVD
jgi:hypothetical protein